MSEDDVKKEPDHIDQSKVEQSKVEQSKQPDQPGHSDQLDQPEQPDLTDQPDRPEQPDQSGQTEQPDKSEQEDHPDRPEKPVHPVQSEPSAREGEDFAHLLAASESREKPEPRPGDVVTGTIVQIGDMESFVDYGGRNELPIATAELRNDEGDLRLQVGDQIKAHVQEIGDEMRLTLALNLRGQNLDVLERAYADKTPIEGKVRQTNKGGFTVDLAGLRAFCPFSQIDLHRVREPESFIGRTLTFRIIELSEDGRNIVLSRRILLEEERAGQASQTRESLGLGDVIEGTITRIAPFGAFVDIGGLEGLVHISQISHQRVQDAASVLQEGQKVKVKVMEIQNLGEGRRERISLSMKVLTTDPWPEAAQKLQIGSEVTGRVTRLADFGAFVELQPGVEGLVHISEMSDRRLLHPREVVTEGEEISIRILDIDLDRRRISLSLKQSQHWDGD